MARTLRSVAKRAKGTRHDERCVQSAEKQQRCCGAPGCNHWREMLRLAQERERERSREHDEQ